MAIVIVNHPKVGQRMKKTERRLARDTRNKLVILRCCPFNDEHARAHATKNGRKRAAPPHLLLLQSSQPLQSTLGSFRSKSPLLKFFEAAIKKLSNEMVKIARQSRAEKFSQKRIFPEINAICYIHVLKKINFEAILGISVAKNFLIDA